MIKNALTKRQLIIHFLILAGSLSGLSFILSWVSSNFLSLSGWASFLVVSFLSSSILWLGWKILKSENPPQWLAWVLVGAALLRITLGVCWYITLPALGYDNEVNNAGYVMSDAWKRDNAAWDLSQSENSLFSAFQGYSNSDQYGGVLFFSAFIYRFFGAESHQPLLIVLVCAAFSALLVPFTWAFSKNLWGEKSAQFSAWFAFLYPEVVLLGSSQMREAFLPTLVILALYWLLKYHQTRNKRLLWGIAVTLLLFSAISGLIILLLLGLLVFCWFALNEWVILKNKWFWIGLGVGVIALTAVALTVNLNSLSWFQVVTWQKYLSESASGWLEKQFVIMPGWTQLPFLFIYGILRPLLPSALAASGSVIWKAIGIWRALGWTFLLAFLIYATFLSFSRWKTQKLPRSLVLAVWLLALVASFWGGADMWDNPRYRAVFAGLQLALAGWAVVFRQESKDPWLRRVLISVFIMVLWFIPWYLRRYVDLPFEWSLIDLPDVVGIGLVCCALYLIWDKLFFESKPVLE